MLRRTPLRSNTRLTTNSGLRGKTRLRTVGAKKLAEIAEVSEWRRERLARIPFCEIGPILDRSNETHYCWRRATGLHERFKRSQGGDRFLTMEENVMSACGPCNSWVEQNPIRARELGLSVSSVDELERQDP